MKRYAVFAGMQHIQYGGMDNFIGDRDAINEAFDLAELQITNNVLEQTEQEYYDNSWIQIFDTKEMIMIWESGEKKSVSEESVYITLRDAEQSVSG